jgi:hypothetical protein
VIGLTCGLLPAVARAERSPAMAGGEAVAARPPRLGLRGNAGDARPSHALGGLEWVQGKSYGSLVCLGRERSKEFIGGANGGRRRLARLLGRVRGGGRGVLYAQGLVDAVPPHRCGLQGL